MLRLRRALQEAPDGQGGCLADAADFKREAAALEVRLAGLQALEARCAAERSAGRNPGAKAQMLEVRSAELCLAVMEMLVEAAGYYALASADSLLLHNEGAGRPPLRLARSTGYACRPSRIRPGQRYRRRTAAACRRAAWLVCIVGGPWGEAAACAAIPPLC